MKIIILDGYAGNPGDLSWNDFEKLGEVTTYDRTPYYLATERIGDAEIVITNKTIIDKNIMDKCSNLKYIGVLATGYNVVDVQEAKKKNIVVTNVPTYSTNAVAQFVFALLLEICHHVGEHNLSVKKGDWSLKSDFTFWNYPLIELTGKTMGIIGYGKIGKATAKLAIAFGMNVLVYNKNKKQIEQSENLKLVDFEELLKKSDVISLHCPLNLDNENMINKNTIEKMKSNVILINTSRGQLVNEKDLAEALNNGDIYGAAVDVVSYEPIKPENPLLNCSNCIITPHIAWAPKETRRRLLDIAKENLTAFLNGNYENVVD